MTPGIYSLSNNDDATVFTITTAATQNSDAVTNLGGANSLSVQGKLTYGSGGTAIKVYIQTSLDFGTTWIDVACLTFATANATKVAGVNGGATLNSAAITDGTLTDDTSISGVLGDRVRAKVVSTGTYASTTLALKMAVR